MVPDSEENLRGTRGKLTTVQTEERKQGPLLVWWASYEATTAHA